MATIVSMLCITDTTNPLSVHATVVFQSVFHDMTRSPQPITSACKPGVEKVANSYPAMPNGSPLCFDTDLQAWDCGQNPPVPFHKHPKGKIWSERTSCLSAPRSQVKFLLLLMMLFSSVGHDRHSDRVVCSVAINAAKSIVSPNRASGLDFRDDSF